LITFAIRTFLVRDKEKREKQTKADGETKNEGEGEREREMEGGGRGREQEANRIFLSLSTVTQGVLLEILDSAARKERSDLSENVWEYMTKRNITPDDLAFNSLLYSYVNARVRKEKRERRGEDCDRE
jgi:hypothetical protein